MLEFLNKMSVVCFLGFFAIMVLFPVSLAGSPTTIVAAVFSSDLPRYRIAHRAFLRALASKGYDQKSVEIVTQVPNPDPISWSNAVRKFNAIGADVMVTYGASVTLVALQESRDIPIVFVDVYAPLETGIAKSLATPGANATGVSSRVPLVTLVKTAMEFKPFRQIGVLYSSREIGSLVQLKEMKRLAVQQGFSVVEANVPTAAVLDNAMSALFSQIDCLYLTEASVVNRQMEKIIRRATERKIPVISQIPESGEKGALVSLEAHPAELGQQAADYVVRVLSGKKSALMPIAAPRKVDLFINVKTARHLDLHVPLQVLNLATRVIK